MTLKRKLQQILNVYGEDNKAGTPDYILAQFLLDCLKAYGKATKSAEKHRYQPGQENDAKEDVVLFGQRKNKPKTYAEIMEDQLGPKE